VRHSRKVAGVRLRYAGSASTWEFAIWRASHDDYQDSWLPTGSPSASSEHALDTACGLYLSDPTAWANQIAPPPNQLTNMPTRQVPTVSLRSQALSAASQFSQRVPTSNEVRE
jgi:hypothetical protein